MNSPQAPLTAKQLEDLRRLDACSLANAIETFHRRLRNEGFVDGSVRALFPRLQPMVGFAATIKIRGSAPPTTDGLYRDRTDWWDYILSVPEPRVIVIEDCETRRGMGALLGAVHANIVRALGCIGAVTNGSVRDLPTLESLGFPTFAGSVSVSHAYVHIIDMGCPVEIGGLKINSHDLLHGDLHGVQTIPLDIATLLPAAAAEIIRREAQIIALCRSPEFSVEKLREAVSEKPLSL